MFMFCYYHVPLYAEFILFKKQLNQISKAIHVKIRNAGYRQESGFLQITWKFPINYVLNIISF